MEYLRSIARQFVFISRDGRGSGVRDKSRRIYFLRRTVLSGLGVERGQYSHHVRPYACTGEETTRALSCPEAERLI